MKTLPNIYHSFAKLGEEFVCVNNPENFPNCQLIYLNEELANFLGFDSNWLKTPAGNNFLLGKAPAHTNAVSMVYAGHQFGQFVPTLGDGRAHLIGEVSGADGRLYDIHLKGSGQTHYSRRGDGKAALAPMLREVLIGECLNAIQIPSSRALAVFTTGEIVYRERALPGAILVRTATSHIRIGTFEYFASRNNLPAINKLIDYSLQRFYPHAQGTNSALLLLAEVVSAQAKLIANWMANGFIHGVLNTDNINIAGISFDFGPCAFMDYFNPAQVYSSIDINGRYAYNQQPQITLWNLQRLAECLLPLINPNPKQAIDEAIEVLDSFNQKYKHYFYTQMRNKLGIINSFDNEQILIDELFNLMSTAKEDDNLGADFITTFSTIEQANKQKVNQNPPAVFLELFNQNINIYDKAKIWWNNYQKILIKYNPTTYKSQKLINPLIIARNHLVQSAIETAEEKFDFSEFNKLLTAVRQPYIFNQEFISPPKVDQIVKQTFCGT